MARAARRQAPAAGLSTEVTFIGVRHHSPACARLVAQTIEALRPAYVLIEGPADFNDRLDELMLGHDLPVAIFTSYRDSERTHASWSPLCDYSPEWTALKAGHETGAEVRFIDLPAWHPAFADMHNRYADADERYGLVTEQLCHAFGVDNADALWDHLVENEPAEGLADRLDTYFSMLRGDTAASASDTARESYMAQWIHAASARAQGRAVVVVCGGFHREALRRARVAVQPEWPTVPEPPQAASARSYLVPYSFKRLDSFHGYQSGMPSPQYYQHVWELGPAQAAASLLEAVAVRLRTRRQQVSTADLIAARVTADGLARIRGHRHPTRTDLLDGLVSALVNEALEQPLPWTGRGRLPTGTHPVVVEMVAALSGERAGRLHPTTPLPPLVHDIRTLLDQHGLAAPATVELALSDPAARLRSHVLHCLRVLEIPGFTREHGPSPGNSTVVAEVWQLVVQDRLAHEIEAAAYGATLAGAAAAKLAERANSGDGIEVLGTVLFDSVLCGLPELTAEMVSGISGSIATASDLGALGKVLAVVLALWRHDRLLGAARGPALGAAICAAVPRLLWLAEGIHGGPAPAEPQRLAAITALRDAVLYAAGELEVDRAASAAAMGRIAAAQAAPPDLRGAALGFCWAIGETVDPARALRGSAQANTVGDWLAGLFAVAREQVLHSQEVLGVIDSLVAAMSDTDFLIGLPALRQAFGYFPPRERQRLAEAVLARHQSEAFSGDLLRLDVDPLDVARGREIDGQVEALLIGEGLIQR